MIADTTTVVCEHGGTCQNLPGTYQCNCPVGFTGRRCEKNINECDSNPCQNDGTCLDERGAYRCICMPGKNHLIYNRKCTNEINRIKTKIKTLISLRYMLSTFLYFYKIFSCRNFFPS